jgi:ElaB/YqjD/DUF883 family membrane-anchored ribosome-binding protein
MSEYTRRTRPGAESRRAPDEATSSQGGYGYPNEPSVQEEFSSTAEELKSKVQDQAQEYGEKAQDQFEAGKQQAAGGMEKAAEMVRERAAQTGGVPAQAGARVADTMESAAGYLREHDTAQMWDDLEAYVRQHPAQALAGAAFAGFIFGRMLR